MDEKEFLIKAGELKLMYCYPAGHLAASVSAVELDFESLPDGKGERV
jgi:hypothetical protein